MMDKTIEYYNQNANKFTKETIDVEFHDVQDKLLNYLKPNSLILDFGCGSGRDSKYFLDKGFLVEAIDGSIEMVKQAREYTGIDVKHQLFEQLDEKDKYDGIWACSSLLHVNSNSLKKIIVKLNKALKKDGLLYMSFKYGYNEEERNGRFFNDMDEKKMNSLVKDTNVFKIKEMWLSGDARKGREDEKWLNVILEKDNK